MPPVCVTMLKLSTFAQNHGPNFPKNSEVFAQLIPGIYINEEENDQIILAIAVVD
jgi:hypothetical protein